MADFRIEFPDFDPATLPEIPAGFEDVSWHNEACPAFHNRKLRLSIFINYLDENLREWESEGRFHIFKTDFDGAHIDEEPGELVTDDWCEVLAYIAHIASIPPRVELFQQGSAGAYRRAAEFRDLAERHPESRAAYLSFSTSYQKQAAEISAEARRIFDLMTAN